MDPHISVDGRVFHKACFKCFKCKSTLNLLNWAQANGVPYCKTHFKEMFMVKGNYDFVGAPDAGAAPVAATAPVDGDASGGEEPAPLMTTQERMAAFKQSAASTPQSGEGTAPPPARGPRKSVLALASAFQHDKSPSPHSRVCTACSKPVYALDAHLLVEGAMYHKACFRCVECKRTLTLKTLASSGGLLYCTEHVHLAAAAGPAGAAAPPPPRRQSVEAAQRRLPEDVVADDVLLDGDDFDNASTPVAAPPSPPPAALAADGEEADGEAAPASPPPMAAPVPTFELDVSADMSDVFAPDRASLPPAAVKWLHTTPGEAGRDELLVEAEAASRLFGSLRNSVWCNLVAVFGAARQGKSFLLNCLTQQQEAVFRVSNSSDPCTEGVDLSSLMLSLPEFAATGEKSLLSAPPRHPTAIGFVDVEGMGDKDVEHDVTLVAPVLLCCKAVLFNWMGGLQKDAILNQLGVLTAAAARVEFEPVPSHASSDMPPESAVSRTFGHLHIVLRDWTYVELTPRRVEQQLLQDEHGDAKGTARRNEIRAMLRRYFATVSVWLLPPPVDETANLSRSLRVEEASPAFHAGVNELRAELAAQLVDPMLLHDHVLTPPALAALMPLLAQAMNEQETVKPAPLLKSMQRGECERLRDAAVAGFDAAVDDAVEEAESAAEPCPNAELRAYMDGLAGKAQDGLRQEASWVPPDLVEDMLGAFQAHVAAAEERVLAGNARRVVDHLGHVAKEAKGNLQAHTTAAVLPRLPLAVDALEAAFQEAEGELWAVVDAAFGRFPDVAASHEALRLKEDTTEWCRLLLQRTLDKNDSHGRQQRLADVELCNRASQRLEADVEASVGRVLADGRGACEEWGTSLPEGGVGGVAPPDPDRTGPLAALDDHVQGLVAGACQRLLEEAGLVGDGAAEPEVGTALGDRVARIKAPFLAFAEGVAGRQARRAASEAADMCDAMARDLVARLRLVTQARYEGLEADSQMSEDGIRAVVADAVQDAVAALEVGMGAWPVEAAVVDRGREAVRQAGEQQAAWFLKSYSQFEDVASMSKCAACVAEAAVSLSDKVDAWWEGVEGGGKRDEVYGAVRRFMEDTVGEAEEALKALTPPPDLLPALSRQLSQQLEATARELERRLVAEADRRDASDRAAAEKQLVQEQMRGEMEALRESVEQEKRVMEDRMEQERGRLEADREALMASLAAKAALEDQLRLAEERAAARELELEELRSKLERSHVVSSSVRSQGPVNREGYVVKRGSFRKSWLRRWFALSGPELKYFKDRGGSSRGTIKLLPNSTCVAVDTSPTEETSPRRSVVTEEGWFHFEITPKPGGRVYMLRVETEADMTQWVQAVSHNIACLQGRKPSAW